MFGVATGTVEGTGAAINIALGFKPAHIEVHNIDGDAILIWNDAMPAASGMKTVAAGTTAHITSAGISLYAGVAATTGEGFTIGADTDVNVEAETICWTAWPKVT